LSSCQQVKKCFLGLRQTALLSAEGKKRWRVFCIPWPYATKSHLVIIIIRRRRRKRRRRRRRRMVVTRLGADYVAPSKKKIEDKKFHLKNKKKAHLFTFWIPLAADGALCLTFYQVRQGRTWSRNYKSPSSSGSSPPPTRLRIFTDFLTTFWQLYNNFWTTFGQLFNNYMITFWQIFDNFLSTFWQLFCNFFIFTRCNVVGTWSSTYSTYFSCWSGHSNLHFKTFLLTSHTNPPF
jgi:hypothetical protein